MGKAMFRHSSALLKKQKTLPIHLNESSLAQDWRAVRLSHVQLVLPQSAAPPTAASQIEVHTAGGLVGVYFYSHQTTAYGQQYYMFYFPFSKFFFCSFDETVVDLSNVLLTHV